MIIKVVNRIKEAAYKFNLKSKKIMIGKSVKLSTKTQFEDNIRIYSNTSIEDSVIGRGTIIGYRGILSNAKIGRFCSIAPCVQIIYGRHPTSNFISTHQAFFSTRRQAGFTFAKAEKYQERKYIDNGFSISIGNDVWIGYEASILEGVKIGDGAIIGAKASVTKDIEPYSINVGVPARKIGYRFQSDEIKLLEEIKWWDKEMEWLKNNAVYFEDINNIEILKSLS